MEGREGKSSDNEVVEAREGKAIEKDNEILVTTRVASKEAELIDEDGVTEVREGKSFKKDNEILETTGVASKEGVQINEDEVTLQC